MDTERSTKTFSTPGGHTVVMFDYITGGEMQQIATKVGKESTREEQIAASNSAITLLVQSLDGSPDNVLERLLNMPAAELNAVTEAVTAIINPDPK